MRAYKWFVCSALLLGSLALLTACGGGGFELGVPSEDVQIVQGETSQLSIEIDRVGGFRGAVEISVDDPPEGIEVTAEPESITETDGALRLSAAEDAPPGTYTLTVRAKSGRLTEEVDFTLHVDPRPDFSVELSPSELALEQGESASVSVQVERQGGFTDGVSLALGEVSPALSAELEDDNADAAILYLSTERGTPAGEYSVVVVGRSEDRERSVRLRVTVEEVPGFDLSADPASLELARGETQEITVRVERWAGFADPVQLEIPRGLPEGLEASFAPNPVDNAESTLVLRASDTTRLGTFSLIVRGTADQLVDEIPIDMIVLGMRIPDPGDGGG